MPVLNDMMQRMLRVLCVMVAAGFLVMGARVHAALPVEGAPATAAYWMRTDGDMPLCTADEIAALNHQIAARTDTVCNLMKHPAMLSGDEVRCLISRASQGHDAAAPTELYADGQPLTWAAWQQVLDNTAAAAVPAEVTVRYAVAVQRTDVRLLPTATGWFSSPDDVHYDALQGTILDPGEAVLVLHTSADGQFSFMRSRDYCGWGAAEMLADTDAAGWRRFAEPEHFVTVAVPQLRLWARDRQLIYQLGAKIPMAESSPDGVRRVFLPLRDVGGRLAVGRMDVRTDGMPVDAMLPIGRLPLTHNNIVRLAFAALGTEYGWGGANEGMDCSSYIENIYRAMGIDLPRDADSQEDAVANLSLMGIAGDSRDTVFRRLPTGAMLFRPGHVMLYLGVDDAGTPLVIHDISSCYENGARRYVRQVVVSGLDFQNARGIMARDTITHVGTL